MPNRRTGLTPRLIAMAALGLLLSACVLVTDPNPLFDVTRDMSQNLRKWRDHGFTNYDYVVRNQCFCILGGVPVRVSVRDGQVVGVVYVSSGLPLESSLSSSYGDVELLFQLINNAINARAADIKATYDPALGYPADVFIDNIRNAADDESGFLVTSLTPVAR
ncbi:MAG: DUF6174 domain-containing protein [Gemmatimonadaceae bacterium]